MLKVRIFFGYKMTKNSKKKCRLEVTVVSGHNLAECNFFFGKSDPFVKVIVLKRFEKANDAVYLSSLGFQLKWHGKKFKTCILRNTVDPVWNDKFLLHFNVKRFCLHALSAQLLFNVLFFVEGKRSEYVGLPSVRLEYDFKK